MNMLNYIKYYFGKSAIYDGKEWQIIDIGIRYVKLRSYTEKDDLGLLVRVEVRHEDLKLVLRRIESMGHDDLWQLLNLRNPAYQYRDPVIENGVLHYEVMYNGTAKRYKKILRFHELNPAQFHYLLFLGIDLFGLIDAGLAIDAATINQPDEPKGEMPGWEYNKFDNDQTEGK